MVPYEAASDIEKGKGKKLAQSGNDNNPEIDDGDRSFMTDFFLEVRAVKEVMGMIRHNAGKLQEFAQEAAVSVDKEDVPGRSQEMQELISTSNNLAGQVRQRLEGMKKGNQQYQFSKDATPTEIRSGSTPAPRQMVPYEAITSVASEIEKGKGKKLAQSGNDNNPEIDDGDRSFMTDFFLEVRAVKVVMGMIRHNAGKLQEYAQEAAVSVDEFMVDAVNELRKTGKLQRGNRKKMCCILIFATIVLIIIIAPILGGVLGTGKK
eukprot:m51a1_g14865 hypothetical protein (263) ;mRNA; f:245121-246468